MSASAGSATAGEWGVWDCSVRYGGEGGGRAATALAAVSLTAPRGSVTAVVGGDGAGKTTLLRMLAGRILPSPGRVAAPAPASIGFMPSTSGVWRDLTVDENVAFVGRAYRVDADRLAERRGALLARAGLLDAADRLGGRLSGGMRQKLGFCLAMLHEPDLLILDEPSTGVDPVSRVELWRMIAEAAAAGRSVVMSTTYLDEAERASSVLVLDAGRTLYQGEPALSSAAVPGTIVRDASLAVGRSPIGGVAPADAVGRTEAWPAGQSWRRGRQRRVWFPGPAPAGLGPIEETPDLEDATVALTLAARSARGGGPR